MSEGEMVAKRHYDVVCGIICDESDQILIALRHGIQEHAGMWEFPGGKVEVGENFLEALTRELEEEIGIQVLDAEPWLQIHHEYPKYHVTLHVWNVLDYSGEPASQEDQDLRWVDIEELSQLEFPEANQAIIEALSEL